jgi:outer membrane lipoprotein-sorting protein
MSIFQQHPGLRWVVPAAFTVLVFSGGTLVNAVSASADPSLPERSAAQLLVDLQDSKTDGLSGTVAQRSDLGLPNIPGLASGGSTSLSSLVAGSHTLKVWYSGPDKVRIALLGTFGETDLVRNSTDLWIWDSQRNTANHEQLEADRAGRPVTMTPPSSIPSDPRGLAELALKMITPSTVVTTAGTARVAGRPAYELVLAPRDATSLVGQVRIAIDATKHMPLRVQVYPKGSDSIGFEAAFTQVNFTRPDDAQFRFNPPAGAKVLEDQASTPAATGSGTAQQAGTAQGQFGSDWTTVVVVLTEQTTSGTADNTRSDVEGLLEQLPAVTGSWGSGHVLSGRLFTALLTDDGRLIVGMVPQDRLTQVAADPKASVEQLRADAIAQGAKATK